MDFLENSNPRNFHNLIKVTLYARNFKMPKRTYAAVSQSASGPAGRKSTRYSKKSWNATYGSGRVNPIAKYFETKSIRKTGLETALSASTSLPLMLSLPMAIGDGAPANQRIGNRATLQSYSGQVLYHNNGTTTGDNVWIREMIIKVPGGHSVSNAEIQAAFYDGTGTSAPDEAAGNLDLTDIVNKLNTDQFKVVLDKTFKLAPIDLGNGAGHMTQRTFSVKDRMMLKFDDGTDQDPSNVRYVYMVYVRPGNNDSIGPNVELTYQFESKYKDI